MVSATTIWLVRHGETAWNREGRMQGHTDIELSPEGEEQARQLAARLKGRHFAALYASDLQRARRTAELLGEAVGLGLLIEPGLREVHVGQLAGLTREEARARFPEYFASMDSSDTRRPGGESNTEHRERVWKAFVSVAERHTGRQVLVVTHGGSIRAILKEVLGLGADEHPRVILENTSITRLAKLRKRWYVATLNDTCHMQ